MHWLPGEIIIFLKKNCKQNKNNPDKIKYIPVVCGISVHIKKNFGMLPSIPEHCAKPSGLTANHKRIDRGRTRGSTGNERRGLGMDWNANRIASSVNTELLKRCGTLCDHWLGIQLYVDLAATKLNQSQFANEVTVCDESSSVVRRAQLHPDAVGVSDLSTVLKNVEEAFSPCLSFL